MELLGYILTLIMGVSLGLIGGGGSILTVPILYYFFSQDSITATSNSLFIVGATALMGAFKYYRKGHVQMGTAVLFALPSFIGVYMARALILPNIPHSVLSVFGVEITKPILIMICFSLIMMIASRAMIRAGRLGKASTAEVISVPLVSITFKGLFVGVVTGFVGAGGGFLIVPALTLLLGLPIRKAVGTSLAIITANSFFGFSMSFLSLSYEVPWIFLFMISGLGILGILIGNGLSDKIAEHHLKKGFGYFVLIVGSLILVDQILRSL
ncbi:MAG: sulfite exporter TauE/SafE family protein [Bdellovibrionales bacterium]|nr:sulfite exporter TauE/SafE family protein [Bdellovibrionales bacterium]